MSGPPGKGTSRLDQLIGRTPMVPLLALSESLDRTLWVKLESRNLGGSVKDRPARYMVEQAERNGALAPGGRIVEATSGNTGIALAQIGVLKGYPVVIVMPEGVSQERVYHLKALGAEVELTPAREGMAGSIRRAEEILSDRPGSFMPRQFENPANPDSHYRTTGPEIVEQLGRIPDGFVAGVGTGGTVTGVGRYLRERKPDLRIWALEPAMSPVLSGGVPGPHRIQGIGAGFVPKNFDRTVCDKIQTIEDRLAIDMTRRLSREEGIMAGLSSGANVVGALALARTLPAGSHVVTIICDSFERYFSMEKYLAL
ncbi:MAG: cysteine synthase A [Leptospirales bacterium]